MIKLKINATIVLKGLLEVMGIHVYLCIKPEIFKMFLLKFIYFFQIIFIHLIYVFTDIISFFLSHMKLNINFIFFNLIDLSFYAKIYLNQFKIFKNY